MIQPTPSTCTMRWSLVTLCAILTLAAGGGCGHLSPSLPSGSKGKSSDTADPVMPVSLATAVAQDVPIQVHAIGWAEAYASVTIRPQIDGQLVEVHFEEGQHVKAGDLLFRIDSRPFVAALRLAEATLLKDEALAADAQRDFERTKKLFKQNMAADREQDQSKANADAAQAQVEADKAAVDNARLRLEYCEIRSPIDGRAGAKLVDSGNIVKNNETALVTINQLSPIYVTFAVAERHLPTIKAQMAAGPLTVVAEFNDEEHAPAQGRLSFIDNQVDTLSGMVRMKAVFDNKDFALWPGRFVNVVLTVSMLHQVVLVPAPAIQTGQKGTYVFVARDDSTVEMRSVIIGPTHDGSTVVTSGLNVSEVVVTDGQLRLVPGSRIRATENADAAATDKEATVG